MPLLSRFPDTQTISLSKISSRKIAKVGEIGRGNLLVTSIPQGFAKRPDDSKTSKPWDRVDSGKSVNL